MKKQKLSKEEKSTNRLIWLYTIIFILVIFLILINYVFNTFVKEPEDIYRQIGNSIPVSISTRNALIIREYAIIPFKTFLQNGDYESAYAMCTTDYKKAYTIDEFIDLYKDIDVSSFDMKEIKAYTDYCYEATIVYYSKNDNTKLNEEKYLLYINRYNTESITISPKGYLFSVIDKDYSKNSLEVHINRIDIYLDKILINCDIKNVDWFSKIRIREIKLGLSENMGKRLSISEEIEKDNTLRIEKEIENSNSLLPDNLQITYTKDEKEFLTEIFYFDDTENG